MTVKLYNFRYILDYKDVPCVGGFYSMYAHMIQFRSPSIYLAWLEVE